jgi:hypothetical protein
MWDQDIFVKNVLNLVDKYCDGSQKKFNDAIAHRDAVTKWKKRRERPSLEVFLRIPDKFSCSLDWLLTGKEPDTTVPSTYNKKNKELHDKVETILNSETTYSGALTDNIHAFHQAVEKDAEAMKYKKIIDDGKGRIESLERDNDDLKQEIIILKEAMKNIQIMHESPNTATGEGDGIKSGKKKT